VIEQAGTTIAPTKDMYYSLRNPLVLLSLLIIATATVSARTVSLDKITRGTLEYFGTVSYEVKDAYAGNHNLEVSISLNTRDTTNLEIIKIEAPDQVKIRFTEMSRVESFDAATGLRATEYKYLADIPEGTEPRIYPITISFAYPGDKNASRSFLFHVGVRNKGKLSIVMDAANTTEFYTGITNNYRLKLENNFPDFPVNIRSVSVTSDPEGLIEDKTFEIHDMSIEPLQRGAIELKLKAAPMSFSNLLSGFSESTRLVVNVTYDDGLGHLVTDLTQPVKVKIRPRDRVLVIAMFVGVLIGAVLKLYLQRLQQQGLITRREVLVAVGITSLIGLVVSFVAVVGQIKIIAFDQMGSYDNPAVIFVIGLAGAVGGAQLLSTFFKSGSSATTNSPQTTTTAPAAKPASS
jgi:hypothetical protein